MSSVVITFASPIQVSKSKRTAADDEEVVRRANAALAWMDGTFAKAKEINGPGVFLIFPIM